MKSIDSKAILSALVFGILGAVAASAEPAVSMPESIIRHDANRPAALVGQKLKQPRALVADRYDGPQQMYQASCALCHGAGVGPVLFGRSLTSRYVIDMVRKGRAGMPAYKPTDLSDADVILLAEWIGKQAGLSGTSESEQ